jgi:hypothetical protein
LTRPQLAGFECPVTLRHILAMYCINNRLNK